VHVTSASLLSQCLPDRVAPPTLDSGSTTMGTESLLVASQLSAISYPSQAETITIQTARRDTPLPSADAPSDLPLEHASYSTVVHSENVGHILLRVIQGGRTIELASLSRDISPVRFLFPAVLLPHPGIFLYEGDEIHILAVTEHGSLYRLVLPIDLQKVWKTRFGKNWCREYQINYTNGTADGLVQAQGPLCVALGFQDGVLLRLDADVVGNAHEVGTSVILAIHTAFLTPILSS
jgi:nuclear pore complex protein Nup160